MGYPLDKLTPQDMENVGRYPQGWDSLPDDEKYDVQPISEGLFDVVNSHAPYTPTMR
jgi:hypothetical protein